MDFDNYKNYEALSQYDRVVECEVCGEDLNNEYIDHNPCNTDDAYSCHETEFEHFAEKEAGR